MKKNLYSFSIAIMFFGVSFAQENKNKQDAFLYTKIQEAKKSQSAPALQSSSIPYTFSYSTGAYNDLASPVSLNNGLTWDDPTFTIPIGFNFTLWNDVITQIDLTGLGALLMAGSTGIVPFIYYTGDLADRAADLNNLGQPGSLSPISYKLEGNPGSHILKVEWKNAGFYGDIDDDNTSTDYVNIQMWLHQGSNDVEFRFGPNSITQPALAYWGDPGPAIGIGLYDISQDTVLFFCLDGNPASPTTAIADLNNTYFTLQGSPASGMIYKFSLTSSGIQEQYALNNEVEIFPNPVLNIANAVWKAAPAGSLVKADIFDIAGKNISAQYISTGSGNAIKVNCSHLSAGTYILKLQSENSTIAYKKLVIAE